MIEHFLVSDIYLVKTITDAYGSIVTDSGQKTLYKGRILDHSEVNFGNREDKDTDAIAWLQKDASVTIGDILREGTDYYRIERLVRAKRGGSTEVVFIKAYLSFHKVIAGVS